MKTLKDVINNSNINESAKNYENIIRKFDITSNVPGFFDSVIDMIEQAQDFAEAMKQNPTDAMGKLIVDYLKNDMFEYPMDFIKFFIMAYYPDLIEEYGWAEYVP